jgi:hypothetical protein
MVKDGPGLECSPAKEFPEESTQEFSPIGGKGVSKEETGKLVRNMAYEHYLEFCFLPLNWF